MINREMITRRRLLKYFGAGISASFLSTFLQETLARSEGLSRKCLVQMTTANGIAAYLHKPFIDKAATVTNFERAPFMQPLAPFNDRMVLVSGLYNYAIIDLHGNEMASYTGNVGAPGPQDPSSASIETVIAKSIGQGVPYPALYLGAPAREWNEYESCYAGGKNQVIRPEVDPVASFGRLFGKPVVSVETVADTLRRKNSVLRFVKADAQRTRDKLPPSERPKLEQMLESLRSYEQRLVAQGGSNDKFDPARCTAPTNPALTLKPRTPTANYDIYSLPDRLNAQADLFVLAFACGLSSVAAFLVNMGQQHTLYPFLFPDLKPDETDIHHHSGNAAMIAKFDQFHAQLFARICNGLTAVALGNGKTLMDDTIAYWMSTNGGSHHDGNHNIPAIIIDGTRQMKGGRYLRFISPEGAGFGTQLGNTEKSYATNDLFISIANAMGVPMTSFGLAKQSRGPLPGLLS